VRPAVIIVGFAAVGIAGSLRVVASAAADAMPGAVFDVRDVMRQRSNRGWVNVYQRIDRTRLSKMLAVPNRR
jgi:hypothetical protein